MDLGMSRLPNRDLCRDNIKKADSEPTPLGLGTKPDEQGDPRRLLLSRAACQMARSTSGGLLARLLLALSGVVVMVSSAVSPRALACPVS
jgi:hypothetical protein